MQVKHTNNYGYYECLYITSCTVYNVGGGATNNEGFHNCMYGVALHIPSIISNPGCSYINTSNANITIQYSCTGSGWT